MIKNEYKINEISIDATAKCFCPLGKDWYTNQFTVNMTPSGFIPDYCEIDAFIKDEINGKHFIIEAAVAMLYEHITEKYRPASLEVLSYVDDAAHSAVTVRRCSYEIM